MKPTRITKMKSDVYNYDCVHYRAWYENDLEWLKKQFSADLNSAAEEVNWKNDRITFVIDFMAEGADAVLATQVKNVISDHCKNSEVLAFVSAVADYNNDASIFECPWYMSSHGAIHQTLDMPCSYKVDKKFICLIRRASWSRARFALPLYKAVEQNLRISFGGANPDVQNHQGYFAYIKLPLEIDTVEESRQYQHDQTNELFWNCLFNIVVETSSQHDKNTWRTKFITEKTFKAFYMRHIPIWFAVPGLVEQVRHLGFDMFDDIVDHSYDGIQDEHFRIQAIVSQVKQLDLKYTTRECQSLRKQLSTRLEKNFQLAKDYALKTSDYKYKVIEQLQGT
jgi:hypothetical protein